MKIHLYQGDLPAGLDLGKLVAIDTETLGLNPHRDRLCLAQLSSGDGVCHAVQFKAGDYAAPNLKRLLADPSVTKLFHFARFDVAMFRRYLGVDCAPIYCTKIASKLVRTYTDRHGLKDLVRELLEHRTVEGAAELRLGRCRAQRKAAGLCRQRCGASACAEGRAGHDAGARGPQPSRQGLFRLSARRAPNSIWPAGKRSTSSPIRRRPFCALAASLVAHGRLVHIAPRSWPTHQNDQRLGTASLRAPGLNRGPRWAKFEQGIRAWAASPGRNAGLLVFFVKSKG